MESPPLDAALHQACSFPVLPAVLALLLLAAACGDGTTIRLGGASASSCSTGESPGSLRLGLLDEAVGFGRRATGGSRGCLVHVTTLADDGPGSLREAIEGPGPRWIVFDVTGDVELASPLRASSDKTVDGRGARVGLRGHGVLIEGTAANVIVESLSITDGEGDAIGISAGAHDLWIDHVALSQFGDGLVDVSHAGTDITVSWSHFFQHDKVMLLGANPEDTEDSAIRATLHHNWFDQTGTYHPRLRRGRAHTFDNFFDRWKSFASGASQGGELVSESNVYASGDSVAATIAQIADDPQPGLVRSTGDSAENGAVITESEPERVYRPSDLYPYQTEPADEALVLRLQAQTGPR